MERLRQITGFFVGDGFWLDGKATFSNTNEDLIRYYEKIITELRFKTSLYRRKKKGNRKDEFTLVAEKRFTEPLIHDLQNMWVGLDKEKSKAFLRGFFDAEGNIDFSAINRGRQVRFFNTDADLIRLTSACLKILNIKHKIGIQKGHRPNRQRCFNVRMFGSSSIGFIKNVKPQKIQSGNYLKGKVHPKYFHIFENEAPVTQFG